MSEPQVIVTPDAVVNPIVRIRGQNNHLYPDARLTPAHTQTLKNMNITERGTTRRRNGYTTYNSTQTAAADWIGLIQETFSDGVELEVVVGHDAKIYTDDGTTRSAVTGTAEVSTDADDRVRWTLLSDTIFGTDGTKRPWTKASTGNAAILTSSAPFAAASGDYCKDFVSHRNFLVALHTKESGTVHSTRVRWCDINPRTLVVDATTWPTDNFAEVYNSGGAIVGGLDFAERLLVFKSDGIVPCRLEYDTGYLELDVGTMIRSVTPLARHSLVARHDFAFCIAKEGAIRINRDLSVQVVTDNIRNDYTDLNQGRLQYAVSWVLEQEHQIHTLVSSSSNTTGHDRVLIYDWESGDVWINTLNDVMNYANRVIVGNEELSWYGDLTGYIYQSRLGDDNGTTIEWEVQMSPNDLGFPNRAKNIINLKTFYRLLSGDAAVTARATLDEGRIPSVSQNLELGTTLTYNSGNKYNAGLIYLGGATLTASFFVNRMADVIAPRWTGTGDVEFLGYGIDFLPAE